MKLLTDFHTHTIYSKNNHGKGTIRDNALKAIEMGLKELWITDHGPSHIMFGIRRREFSRVRQEIDELNLEFAGRLKIYFGVESNVMSYKGSNDIGPEELKYLDGVNLGFHYGIINPDLPSFFYFWIANPLAKIFKFMRPWIREKNTDALINIIRRNDIKIITHPGDKVPVNIKRLARACQELGTALEVNSSHENLSREDLLEIRDMQVLISVGSDAHSPKRVGDFSQALERIEDVGIAHERIINLRG
ncbi:MAG: PHP domain-containing protein [Tissierellia bacterium]|nr:PHP domain-containing protein [Tissierellia bacterium]